MSSCWVQVLLSFKSFRASCFVLSLLAIVNLTSLRADLKLELSVQDAFNSYMKRLRLFTSVNVSFVLEINSAPFRLGNCPGLTILFFIMSFSSDNPACCSFSSAVLLCYRKSVIKCFIHFIDSSSFNLSSFALATQVCLTVLRLNFPHSMR